MNVDPIKVKGPSSSRAKPAVNKGKGLATSVHLFKPICKKPKKKKKEMFSCARDVQIGRAHV